MREFTNRDDILFTSKDNRSADVDTQLTLLVLLDIRDQNAEIISLLSRKKSPVMMKEVELTEKEIKLLNNLEE